MIFRYHPHTVLTVRPAIGDEDRLPFGGQNKHPDVGEVFVAGDADQSDARRWTNRPTALSAVTAVTLQTGISRGVIANFGTKAITA